MMDLKEYIIPFVGLKLGLHRFDYRIRKEFFDFYEFEDFNTADFNVVLDFDKRSTVYELNFKFNGVANVNCDVSNEEYNLDLDGSLKLIVKFGDSYNNDNPEILIIPHGEYEINVAQFLYEMIVLAVPTKKVHPGIEDGSLVSEILEKLDELQPDESIEKEESTDPRWDDLKKLLTDK